MTSSNNEITSADFGFGVFYYGLIFLMLWGNLEYGPETRNWPPLGVTVAQIWLVLGLRSLFYKPSELK